jgi:hypothetical protein
MRFTWYELRTTDLESAASFYPAVVGWEAQRHEGGFLFHRQGEPLAALGLLPEPARARGAPANWLGLISVPEVEAWVQRFVARGAERLGPVRRVGTGEVAVLRAPQGEVIGLGSGARGPSRAVAWHELHTADAERSWSFYSGLLDWRSAEAAALADVGPYRSFSWDGSEGNAGGMSSLAQEPQIHPHWLYYFAVADLDHALAQVGALGGRVADGPRLLPGGDRIAYCEDAQGAAFGLRARAPAGS